MSPSLCLAIVAGSPDAVLIIDDHGRVQDANPMACQLLGYSRENLLQRRGDELVPAMAEARAAYAARGSWRDEIELARKDGALVPLEAWLLLIPDSTGSLAAVFLRTRTKTARMPARAEQWASDSTYRSLVEQLPVAVYILAADENQTPVYFSPYIEALTGETPEEALALQHHWLQLVHPEDRARVAAEDARTMASGATFRIEYRHVRKDGSYVWVRDECVPIRDEAGQIVAWQGLMLDISERVRLEAVEGESRIREEQRDQLRIILDHLPAGVLILHGSDGQVEQANTTAMQMIFGPAAARDGLPVYGRDFRFLRVDGTPLTLEQRLGLRALYGKVVGHEHLLLERQDGSLIPVLAHAAPLPETSGEPARAVLVQQDVTRLREAEQLKDDFLALVCLQQELLVTQFLPLQGTARELIRTRQGRAIGAQHLHITAVGRQSPERSSRSEQHPGHRPIRHLDPAVRSGENEDTSRQTIQDDPELIPLLFDLLIGQGPVYRGCHIGFENGYRGNVFVADGVKGIRAVDGCRGLGGKELHGRGVRLCEGFSVPTLRQVKAAE